MAAVARARRVMPGVRHPLKVMNNIINSLPVANLLGSFFGAALALSLWRDRDLGVNKFFPAILLVSSVSLGCISLDHGLVSSLSAWLEHIEFSTALALGPLLYFYVRSVNSRSFAFRPLGLLHWMPIILYLVGVAVFSLLGSGLRLPVEFIMAHQMSYTLLATRTYFLERNSSEAETTGRSIFPVWGLLCMFAILHLAQLLRLTFNNSLLLREIVPLVGTICFYALCIIGLHYLSRALRVNRPSQSQPKYYKSSLTEEAASRSLARLFSLIETERLYTDPKLTLLSLAQRLAIPSQHLSQIINQQIGQSFFDFVNRYRVEEVKKKLLDPKHDLFTIDALAFSAGFNSRSGFYSVFKKLTGMTPSQFRQTRNGPALKPDALPATASSAQ